MLEKLDSWEKREFTVAKKGTEDAKWEQYVNVWSRVMDKMKTIVY